MNVIQEIRARFRRALQSYPEAHDELLTLVRPAQNPQFGDYQANLAMPLAKRLGGRNPRELAEEIVQHLSVDDICHQPQVAGAGFINLRLKDGFLRQQLAVAFNCDRVGVEKVANPRTYVIDFSSPNVAKPMHVGHIRSTVIGDSLSRILRFLGHQVITDNHLGDWGTQFGMIIYGYKHFLDRQAYHDNPIGELSRLYRHVRMLTDFHEARAKLPLLDQQLDECDSRITALDGDLDTADGPARRKIKKERSRLIKKQKEIVDLLLAAERTGETVTNDQSLSSDAESHPAIGTAVLEETARLHDGDVENTRLWRQFLPHCMEDLHRIYEKLGVEFDVEHGESFYHDQLASVVEELTARGLARESEGAICVFLEGYDAPMIVRKKDGAFLYATSDLATIRYRAAQWDPDTVLYVVDHRQGEHFDKLFAAARQWGYDRLELVHVEFGTVMGEDGKPFRTRAGDIVGLEGLADEAVRRALLVVRENAAQSDLSTDEQQHIAEIVGLGALKYADLSHQRNTDYVFSYDKMLALQGNTAPYLQYSYARNQGIFRRGGIDVEALRRDDSPFVIDTDSERDLAMVLIRFAENLDDVLVDYRPNLLCNYLYELSKTYATFFENCPVLKAENDEVRTSRLKLCDLTQRTIKTGLFLLGIEVSQRM